VSPRTSGGGQAGTTTNATGGRQMNTAPTGAGAAPRSGGAQSGGAQGGGSQGGFGSQQKQ